jgi:hypothetical protein
MVRSEYKYHTLMVWVFDFAQQDGKGGGIGRHTPVRCSSLGQRPSPLGKEDREQRSRGKGGSYRTSGTRAAAGQGSVAGGARAESGGRWGSGGREMGRGGLAGREEENDSSRRRASFFCCSAFHSNFASTYVGFHRPFGPSSHIV